MDQGILVGCDVHQQWLLPWWWENYSAHNPYPVVFIDLGMSEEARKWCAERGSCLSLTSIPQFLTAKNNLPQSTQASWEERYGDGFWIRRKAWFQKPFSLLQSPFSIGVWVDIDCQVKGSLEGLFHCMNFGTEIAVSKDRFQDFSFVQPGEVQYNSGVIVFRKEAPILEQWVKISYETEHLLPGDQETLSRAIFIFSPKIVELPPTYNWYRTYGSNENAKIYHFCGGVGKIELMKKFTPKNEIEKLLLLQSLLSSNNIVF